MPSPSDIARIIQSHRVYKPTCGHEPPQPETCDKCKARVAKRNQREKKRQELAASKKTRGGKKGQS